MFYLGSFLSMEICIYVEGLIGKDTSGRVLNLNDESAEYDSSNNML